MEDSLLDGFADPWPRPSTATFDSPPVAAAADNAADNAADTDDAMGDVKGGKGAVSSLVGVGVGGQEQRQQSSPLRLPNGVLLKHAVQVWNALCVLPRPMGLRPPPTLEQLMQAISILSQRWVEGEGGGRGGSLVKKDGGGGGGGKEEDGEAEFDDRKASIRATRGGRRGRGGGKGKGGEEERDEEAAKKEAQALLDGVCMSIVRVLALDLHTVLGR